MSFGALLKKLIGGAAADAHATNGNDGDAVVSVVVTLLDGDDGSFSERMVSHLSDRSGLAVKFLRKTLLQDAASAREGFVANAIGKGRAWVAHAQAHVLVWGYVEDGVARLYFMTAEPSIDLAFGGLYVGESLSMPVTLNDQMADLIAAYCFCAAVIADKAGHEKRFVLLKSTFNGLSQGVGEKQGMSRIAEIIGYISREEELLEKSTGMVGTASTMPDSDGDDIDIAGLERLDRGCSKARKADVLGTLGKMRKDPTLMTQSMPVYKEALDDLSIEIFPDDYASLQYRHATMLQQLAMTTFKAEHLQEAVLAYEGVSMVWSADRRPHQWAMVRSNMARLLTAYGDNTSGTGFFDQAIHILNGINNVWTPTEHPAQWASVQNSMGVAYFSKGKRDGEAATLNEASNSFRRALEVYQEQGNQKAIEMTQKNIIRVERLATYHENVSK